MKFKIRYNEKPLKSYLANCMAIISDMTFDEEKDYKLGKGTAFPMTMTTDMVEPIKDAIKKISVATILFIKESNKDVEKN